MSMNDTLASALSAIMNNEKIAKKEIIIYPVSKIIKSILNIMNNDGYIGSMQEIERSNGNILKVNLLGKINKCGSIRPRYSVKLMDYEKFENRYLPADGMGILLVSTSKGIMTHEEAKKKKLGGRLLAYCY